MLTLHSPPPTLKIYALQAYVDQTVRLTSFRDPSRTATVRQKGTFVEVGWQGPYTAKAVEQAEKTGNGQAIVLFDASTAEGGWVYEDVVRLVSASGQMGSCSGFLTRRRCCSRPSRTRVR